MTFALKSLGLRSATIPLPASKSISNRALIISSLIGTEAEVVGLSNCDDTEVLVEALKTLSHEIDIKASGTAMRFLTSYLSIVDGEHVLTGTHRMQQRPIGVLVSALRALGADISYVGEEGYPPLLIKGQKLKGGEVEMRGNVSSQYVSSLLMIAPTMERGLTVHLEGEVLSRSYIDLTLGMMREYGAMVEWADVSTIVVEPQMYQSVPYAVESDWSAASYWYELMALSEEDDVELRLVGLKDFSMQGDSKVRYIFSLLGVKTTFGETEEGEPMVVLRKGGVSVPKLTMNFANCPDVAQTLVCTCCGMGIPFDFEGLSTLRIKETDRLVALERELRKLGFVLEVGKDNSLKWTGERCVPTMEAIDTYEDHRMAMAIAPMALRMDGVRINHAEVVSKSYPDFWRHAEKVAFEIEKKD